MQFQANCDQLSLLSVTLQEMYDKEGAVFVIKP